MVIKIYFNDKPLFLCDETNEELERYKHHDDAVFIDELSPHAINAMIYEMQQENVHAGIFFATNIEALRHAFWKKFQVILAGGGLVRNETQEVLMMFRRGKWDLPKGKLDAGETIETCALREVTEETGVSRLQLIGKRLETYHTYKESGKFILKESHWFDMTATGKEALVPQTIEGITELKWVSLGDMEPLLNNAYPSVVDVIRSIDRQVS